MSELDLTDEEVSRLTAAIEAEGYAIVPDAIPRDFLEALTATIDRLLVDLKISYGGNNFLGFHTRRIFNLLARDEIFRSVPTFGRVLPVVERILDSECLLSSLTAIEMNPRETRQPLHCDDGSHGMPRPGPPSILIATWALTDFTADNGGTHLVPGSHRFDRRPRRGDTPDTVQVEMPAGSILFYDGSLWHGGGANASAGRRMGIVNNYCAGFLRQEECQLLALPREQVAGFSPRLRRLVGYGTYKGLLGHVDQQSPETLIDPAVETEMIWGKIGGSGEQE